MLLLKLLKIYAFTHMVLLGRVEQYSLVDQKITVAHARQFLSEIDWVKFKVICRVGVVWLKLEVVCVVKRDLDSKSLGLLH